MGILSRLLGVNVPAIQALTPPFGGGPGFQLDFVDTRLTTLSSTPPSPPRLASSPPPFSSLSSSDPGSFNRGSSSYSSSLSSSSGRTQWIAWIPDAPLVALRSIPFSSVRFSKSVCHALLVGPFSVFSAGRARSVSGGGDKFLDILLPARRACPF